jgi:hypothetical protein
VHVRIAQYLVGNRVERFFGQRVVEDHELFRKERPRRELFPGEERKRQLRAAGFVVREPRQACKMHVASGAASSDHVRDEHVVHDGIGDGPASDLQERFGRYRVGARTNGA